MHTFSFPTEKQNILGIKNGFDVDGSVHRTAHIKAVFNFQNFLFIGVFRSGIGKKMHVWFNYYLGIIDFGK